MGLGRVDWHELNSSIHLFALGEFLLIWTVVKNRHGPCQGCIIPLTRNSWNLDMINILLHFNEYTKLVHFQIDITVYTPTVPGNRRLTTASENTFSVSHATGLAIKLVLSFRIWYI